MLTSKKSFITVIVILLCIFSNAQDDPINRMDSILYYPATSEPGSDWNKIGFDDSSWERGGGFVGYGDYADTEIDHVQSVYTRSFFTIDAIENYEELVLICDFDDGFVAYINGVEFARVNLGASGSATSYDQLADRSRESQLTRDFQAPVPGYYIDKAFIDSVLIEGENVLSIEVHNDSINGSDLASLGALFDITSVNYNIFDLLSRYKKSVQLDSTKLPIIVIESGEMGIPYKRIEVDATIGIITNEEGLYNKPGDSYNGHSGPIQIELRGESSATFPKQSFDFELRDDEGKDTSISLLGMPRESDWILQGPFADKSLIRNAIIYELGRRTGHWNPRVKFCEVIVNGEYVGLYNLVEKIKRDSNRVNIGKLRSSEISGTDLTGGYILKYDKPGGLFIVYPKEKNLQPEQEDYIFSFINEYDSILNSNDGLDEQIGYKKYIDENSLIDYALIAEFSKNCDSYLYSTYLYKDKDDRDGRIKFGPLWDFDLCFGNSIWQDGHQTYDWQFEYSTNNKFQIERLFEDPSLVDRFEDRWFELRSGMLHIDSIFGMIDTLTKTLADPIKRNYEVWPVADKGLFYPAYIAPSFAAEIDTMKLWISQRIEWMDNNITDIYYPVTVYPSSSVNPIAEKGYTEPKVYPNPFSNELYLDMYIPESGNLLIELIDIQGRVTNVISNVDVDKGDYKVYWRDSYDNLTSGLYIVSIRLDGKLIDQKQILNMK